ncbi:MAG: N-acetylmuramoyl-L-alanine amidase [Verrucomicrobia bacterium]|nr:MAG: N-acetylmuramoyl-L-alanine amidase [Verrucomicrobiota bacterium]
MAVAAVPIARAARADARPPTRPQAAGIAADPGLLPLPEPVSVRAFAANLGLEPAWSEDRSQLRLTSRWSRIEFRAGSREMALNGVRAFLGEPAVPADDDLLISPIDRDRFLNPILAPQLNEPLAPIRHIVIDPGHGGSADGTRNDALKLLEKHLTLKVSLLLGDMLEQRGFKVSYTRTEDIDLDLAARPAFAREVGADLFLSIHFNSARADVRGIETYLLTRQHQRSTGNDKREPDDAVALPGNAFDPWNAHLGFTVHRQMVRELEAFDRGLKQARFAVLKTLECPGLLLECGYLSNPEEGKLIGTEAHQRRIATAIANGVDIFNQTLKRLQAVREGRTVR